MKILLIVEDHEAQRIVEALDLKHRNTPITEDRPNLDLFDKLATQARDQNAVKDQAEELGLVRKTPTNS